MSKIGNTEALEAYLKLQEENTRLTQENSRLKLQNEEYHKAWDKVAKGINTLFNWLEQRDKTKSVRRRMAEIFKFAYMEAQFEDMRAKWPINQKQTIEAKELKSKGVE